MKIHEKLFVVLIVLLVVTTTLFAQSNAKNPYPSERIAALKMKVEKLLKKRDTSGALRLLEELKDGSPEALRILFIENRSFSRL